MWQELCSKGRKMATNYLSGTTFILSNGTTLSEMAPVGVSFPKSGVEILLLKLSEQEVVYLAPAYGGHKSTSVQPG
jgi:hypothetical protein